MILVDVNLLVYAYASASPEHPKARQWLDQQFADAVPVGLPWESLTGFVRLVSNPRVMEKPATVADAWDQVERWLGVPNVWVPAATAHHATVVSELVRESELAANDVPDLHLAAIAISHGLKLMSHDSGFGRFAGLRWVDPLLSPPRV